MEIEALKNYEDGSKSNFKNLIKIPLESFKRNLALTWFDN